LISNKSIRLQKKAKIKVLINKILYVLKFKYKFGYFFIFEINEQIYFSQRASTILLLFNINICKTYHLLFVIKEKHILSTLISLFRQQSNFRSNYDIIHLIINKSDVKLFYNLINSDITHSSLFKINFK
jgi:hypothetical protein